MNYCRLNQKMYAPQDGQWTRMDSFLLSFSLGFLLAFLGALVAPSSALAGDVSGILPQQVQADQQQQNPQASSIHSGLVSGKVTETDDSLIIDGGTFVADGEQPVLKVDPNTKKKIILRNSRIISNNQRVTDLDDDFKGTAGLVSVDNTYSNSKVVMRNVRMTARNASVTSISDESDSCAGLVCSKAGAYDNMQTISTTAVGHTNISAEQGARPDYRKAASTMRYGTPRAAPAASMTAGRASAVMSINNSHPDYRKVPRTN